MISSSRSLCSLVRRDFVAKRCTEIAFPAPLISYELNTENNERQQPQRRAARFSSLVPGSSVTELCSSVRNYKMKNLTSQRRFISTTGSSATSVSPTPPSQTNNFEETMDNIFHESQKAAASAGDQWFVDETLAQEAWDPKWWNIADQAVNAVNFLSDVTGWHYAGSILAVTCTIRLVILPLAIRGQR